MILFPANKRQILLFSVKNASLLLKRYKRNSYILIRDLINETYLQECLLRWRVFIQLLDGEQSVY